MKNSIVLTLVVFLYLSACQSDKYPHGAKLYENYCERCHMQDGTGLEGLIPPLAGSDYYEKNYAQIPHIIRYGVDQPIVVNGVTYTEPMVGLGRLTNTEIANIMNYINNQWYPELKYVSPLDVAEKME